MSRFLCSAALIAFAAAPALAADDSLAAAWDAAAAGQISLVSDGEFAQLNVIAYHSAVAGLCDGFELDETEVAAATDAILKAVPDGLTAEQLVARHVDVLVALGTARGLFLAEGSLHNDRFCAQAQVTRDEPDFDDLWAD